MGAGVIAQAVRSTKRNGATMYQNLKGTYTGYQRQRQRDEMAEQWQAVKIAAAVLETENHAEAIKAEMDQRLRLAFGIIDDFKNTPEDDIIYCLDCGGDDITIENGLARCGYCKKYVNTCRHDELSITPCKFCDQTLDCCICGDLIEDYLQEFVDTHGRGYDMADECHDNGTGLNCACQSCHPTGPADDGHEPLPY